MGWPAAAMAACWFAPLTAAVMRVTACAVLAQIDYLLLCRVSGHFCTPLLLGLFV
jgi:hypothetical protein